MINSFWVILVPFSQLYTDHEFNCVCVCVWRVSMYECVCVCVCVYECMLTMRISSVK